MREQRAFKTEGIILKRSNYGEADKILTVYTKYHGKVRAIAKGVRKLTSRKAGSLELFNHTVLFLVKGKNMDIITETQCINLFKSWRRNLNKVGLAYYFCELVDKLTPDNQPNQIVFDILKEHLETMDSQDNFSLVRGFEEKILHELGFGVPEIFAKTSGSLRVYIESIIEKKLNSPKILKQL